MKWTLVPILRAFSSSINRFREMFLVLTDSVVIRAAGFSAHRICGKLAGFIYHSGSLPYVSDRRQKEL
jgi:hypothetical protein